jgi:hypothetical protein
MRGLSPILLLVETYVEVVYALFQVKSLLPPLLEKAPELNTLQKRCPEAFRSKLDWMLRCLPGRITCLVRSVAATRVLRRRGFSAFIKVAPHKLDQNSFIAHAWVDLSEGRIIGHAVSEYPPFSRVTEGTVPEAKCR